jgi:hypothetical protein
MLLYENRSNPAYQTPDRALDVLLGVSATPRKRQTYTGAGPESHLAQDKEYFNNFSYGLKGGSGYAV